MREEAFKRIGHLYPQVDLATGLPVFSLASDESPENSATVIAWLWVRDDSILIEVLAQVF